MPVLSSFIWKVGSPFETGRNPSGSTPVCLRPSLPGPRPAASSPPPPRLQPTGGVPRLGAAVFESLTLCFKFSDLKSHSCALLGPGRVFCMDLNCISHLLDPLLLFSLLESLVVGARESQRRSVADCHRKPPGASSRPLDVPRGLTFSPASLLSSAQKLSSRQACLHCQVSPG